jgi:translation elongation factor EF-4
MPVINKMDLASARPDEVATEIEDILGVPKEIDLNAADVEEDDELEEDDS